MNNGVECIDFPTNGKMCSTYVIKNMGGAIPDGTMTYLAVAAMKKSLIVAVENIQEFVFHASGYGYFHFVSHDHNPC
jgi:hypothetical protein